METLVIVGLMVLAVIAVFYFIRRGKKSGSGKVTTSSGYGRSSHGNDGPEPRREQEIDPSTE